MDSNPILQWLAAQCRWHLLNEKWLVTDQLRVAQLWRDRLVLAGCDHLNLHVKTLPMLTREIARPLVVRQQGEMISSTHMQLLIRSTLHTLIGSGQLNYFTPANLHSIDGLARLMARSFEDLQLAGVAIETIADGCMESDEKAADWRLVLKSVRDKLREGRWFDYAGCLQLVSQGLHSGQVAVPSQLCLLLPEELPLRRLEREMLEALTSHASISQPPRDLPSTSTTASPAHHSQLHLGHSHHEEGNQPAIDIDGFVALGEVNEIRGVFQRALHQACAGLDEIEILFTDYQAYVPLIFDTFCQWQQTTDPDFFDSVKLLDQAGKPSPEAAPSSTLPPEMPVTFAEGIACVYSRPGRLLRSWMRWAASDYVQSDLVAILREGLLQRPDGCESFGYARLASALRRVPIGFGFDRYQSQIDKELGQLRSERAEYKTRHERHGKTDAEIDDRDFGIPVLEAVQSLLNGLWPLMVRHQTSVLDTLHNALELLRRHARAESKLDRYALARLCEDIEEMITTWSRFPELDFDVCAWLENLPANSRILASSPRPGAVHVAPVSHGGASGRPHSYILGMDESRFPRMRSVDPLLLDAERVRLSAELETSQTLALRENRVLEQLLARKHGQPRSRLTLSYCTRRLRDDRDCFPSPLMIDLLRKQNRTIESLDQVTFISRNPDEHLDPMESSLARLLATDSLDLRTSSAAAQYPLIEHRQTALRQMSSPTMTAYDGLVPVAGQRWSERLVHEHASPSRLESMGSCPRRFFFRHTLGIAPPDDCEIDPTRWLSPLTVGNLIHELFEEFLRDLTQQGLVPDPKRDSHRLQRMLNDKLVKLVEEVAIPNVDAYEQQRDELADFCEIFLAKEAEYCETHSARPWVVEASLGAHGPEPREANISTPLDCETAIPLTLSDGSCLRLAGRMDRVDQLMIAGSERYVIWDYKSGSDRDFKASDPLVQGRKLQPFLYLHMLRHRLMERGHASDCVQAFGYFFPSPRTEGRRLEWTALQLQPGQSIIEQLTQLITQGVFIATDNAEDCKYCDYASVCGDPARTVALTQIKMQHADNVNLEPWRALRHG